MAAIDTRTAGSREVVAFLDLIAFSEGTSLSPITRADGYDVIVTGADGPRIFSDMSDHPFAGGKPGIVVRVGPPKLISTASGRYQLLARYWPGYKAKLGLRDFEPMSQDLVAIQQIRERHALQHIVAGEIEVAIALVSNIWASLPGNTYGQGGHTLATLMEEYPKLLEAVPA